MTFEITFTTFAEGGGEIVLTRGEYPALPEKGDTVIVFENTYTVNSRRMIYGPGGEFRAQINITKCDFLMGEVV